MWLKFVIAGVTVVFVVLIGLSIGMCASGKWRCRSRNHHNNYNNDYRVAKPAISPRIDVNSIVDNRVDRTGVRTGDQTNVRGKVFVKDLCIGLGAMFAVMGVAFYVTVIHNSHQTLSKSSIMDV